MQSGGFNMGPQLMQQYMGNTMGLQQQAAQTAFLPSMLSQRLRQMNIENSYLPMNLGTQAFANAANPLSNILRDRAALAFIPGLAGNTVNGLAGVMQGTGVNTNPFFANTGVMNQAQQNLVNSASNAAKTITSWLPGSGGNQTPNPSNNTSGQSNTNSRHWTHMTGPNGQQLYGTWDGVHPSSFKPDN